MRKNALTRNEDRSLWANPLFDDFIDRSFLTPFSLFNDINQRSLWNRMNFTVEEEDNAYVVCMDMPGIRKEDIRIDVSGNVLTVVGERHESSGKEGAESSEERSATGRSSYRHYEQSFTLPASVDADQVEAHLEDGVLRVALPFSEKAKPRKIEIQSGKGGFFSKLIGSEKSKSSTSGTMDDRAKH